VLFLALGVLAVLLGLLFGTLRLVLQLRSQQGTATASEGSMCTNSTRS
jgi:predicted Zn-dependent peptidase